MRHICFTGVESTGKTSLAQQLAIDHGAALMPEYGRNYAETIGTDFTPDALRHIAAEHARRRAALLASGPALLIEDTDIVTTAAWFRMLHGTRDPWLSAQPSPAQLHLLFAPDTPWVADGTRQFTGAERERFHRVIVDELHQRGCAIRVIAGSWADRRAGAEAVLAQREMIA